MAICRVWKIVNSSFRVYSRRTIKTYQQLVLLSSRRRVPLTYCHFWTLSEVFLFDTVWARTVLETLSAVTASSSCQNSYRRRCNSGERSPANFRFRSVARRRRRAFDPFKTSPPAVHLSLLRNVKTRFAARRRVPTALICRRLISADSILVRWRLAVLSSAPPRGQTRRENDLFIYLFHFHAADHSSYKTLEKNNNARRSNFFFFEYFPLNNVINIMTPRV